MGVYDPTQILDEPLVTRFNPTCNGDLHLGHIFMALVNRDMARETGGKLAVVPDAGHYPQVEFPGQIVTAIADFLAETPS